MDAIHTISKKRFDAIIYCRQPLARLIAREVAWFEIGDKKNLATIMHDFTDNDYGWVILGRDKRKIFRAIDFIRCDFFKTPELAKEDLFKAAKKYEQDSKYIYVQGDEVQTPNDIFIPVVKDEKLHPYFKILKSENRYEAARELIKEVAYTYKSPDNHYIREFQTEGFEARLWELYLYCYLYNAFFTIKNTYEQPDFECEYYGQKCWIEAVTVNPSKDKNRPDPSPPKNHEEFIKLKMDYLPIKYGSPLYSKLNKKYWELDHVKGHPLIIAIHDFHMTGSMTWSRSALSDYLYGIRNEIIKSSNGINVGSTCSIDSHTWNGKTIPSNFFSLPGCENISGVLFSNCGTLPKFNRMGKLAGLGSHEIKIIRIGHLYDPNPNSFTPIPFSIDLDDPNYEESWSDSIVLYHNPNAIHPIPEGMFDDISHITYNREENIFYGNIKPYDVLSSISVVIQHDGDRITEEECLLKENRQANNGRKLN